MQQQQQQQQQFISQQTFQQMAIQRHHHQQVYQQVHQPPWQQPQATYVVRRNSVQQGFSLASKPSVVSVPQQLVPTLNHVASYGDNQQQVVPLPASRVNNECESASYDLRTSFDRSASQAYSPSAFPGTGRSPMPSLQDSTNLEYYEVSLKEWIKGAIDTVSKREDISLESAATSPTYLKSALRVAYMLTDQLCTTEGGSLGNRDTKSEVPRRPSEGMAWMRKVSVFTGKYSIARGIDDAKDRNRGVPGFMNDPPFASFGSLDPVNSTASEPVDASDRSETDELIARLMGGCDSTSDDPNSIK